MTHDGPTEQELTAYVDGELAPRQRLAMETYLREHPAVAATLIGDLSARDELRRWLGAPAAPVDRENRLLARRLGRRLALRRVGRLLRWSGLAAIAPLMLTASWLALGWSTATPADAAGKLPPVVQEALDAYATLEIELRQGLTAPAERTDALVLAALGGPTPLAVPPGWRIVASELVPWDGGTAIQRVLEKPGGAWVVVFSARTEVAAAAPVPLRQVGLNAAWWAQGGTTHVLLGGPDLADLEGLAYRLAGH